MIIPALVHIGLLFAIGVPGDVVLLTHLHLVGCHFAGRALIRWLGATGDALHPDPAVRLVLSTTTGAIVFAVLLGIALHWTTAPAPLIATARLPLLAALAWGGFQLWRGWRRSGDDALASATRPFRGVLGRFGVEATIALVLSTCTMLGFNNSPNPTLSRTSIPYGDAPTDVPSWGYQGDKGTHLVILPDQLVTEGLPSSAVGHRGVQLTLLPIVLETGRYSAFDFVGAFKTAGLWVWLALLLVLRSLGRDVYALSERQSLALAVSTVFLGAISIPLLAWPASTYAGFVKPTLSTFHNATQLYSLLVGVAGALLLLDGFGQRRNGWALGVFLLSASFFYKPSTFTILAPFFLGYGLLWVRSLGLQPVAYLSTLCLIPLGWLTYLQHHGIETPPLAPTFSPFLLYLDRAAWRFPEWIVARPSLLAGAILACSFLWAGMVTAPYLRNLIAWRLQRSSARFAIPLTIFVVGSVISLVVVEDTSRQAFGNFAWFGHVAYLLAMPVFFWCFVRLRPGLYKALCTVALVAHLAAGVQHLAYFTLEAKIVGRPPGFAAKTVDGAD